MSKIMERKRLLFEPSDLAKKRLKAASEAVHAASITAPIDLSGKRSDEVITLSDDEEEEIHALAARGDLDATDEQLVGDQDSMIRRLQASLRNEESKLFLLKSLRHFQKQSTGSSSASKEQTATTTTPAPSSTGRPATTVSNVVKQQQTTSSSMSNTAQNLSRSIPKPQSTSSLPTKASPSPVKQATPHVSQSQLNDLKAQKKLALRKQLEKSLLEIPNPQPPPSELNFIPSTATNEFIALVGLEEVVKNIAEHESLLKGAKPTEVKFVIHPFSCVQCGTDYTPVWKRDKPGSKNVICEQCVGTNQKSQIKKEHTARLKACFVKALKQEDEIEKDFKRYAGNPSAALQAFPHLATTPVAPAAPSLPKAASSANISNTQRSSTTSQQQSAAAMTAELQRQQAQLFQVAQLQAMGQLFPGATGRSSAASAAAFPYGMPASYLNMLQQAARSQGLNFNPANLWSALAGQQQRSSSKK